jgi:hypothetical protein
MFDDQTIESLPVGFLGQEPDLEVIQDFLFRRSRAPKSTFVLSRGKK